MYFTVAKYNCVIQILDNNTILHIYNVYLAYNAHFFVWKMILTNRTKPLRLTFHYMTLAYNCS